MDISLIPGEMNNLMAKTAGKSSKGAKKNKPKLVTDKDAQAEGAEVTESKEVSLIEESFVDEGEFKPDTQPMVSEADDKFSMPSDEARKRAMELKDEMKDHYVEMCRLLFYIHRKTLYSNWGFSTFDDYVASELMFEKSKARHLVQIWECLYERQGDKTVFNKVIALGWTKATILQHVVNAENVEEWTEKGSHMSCEQLRKEVKTYLAQKISDDPSEALDGADEVEGTNTELAMKTMNLQLHHDDYLAICQAIEAMQKIEPGISISNAIALIARDFMSAVPQEGMELNNPKGTFVEMIKKYEQHTTLKMVVIDPEDKAILHGFENLALIAGDIGEGDNATGVVETKEPEAEAPSESLEEVDAFT
jgi:hypothetical protein